MAFLDLGDPLEIDLGLRIHPGKKLGDPAFKLGLTPRPVLFVFPGLLLRLEKCGFQRPNGLIRPSFEFTLSFIQIFDPALKLPLQTLHLDLMATPNLDQGGLMGGFQILKGSLLFDPDRLQSPQVPVFIDQLLDAPRLFG